MTEAKSNNGFTQVSFRCLRQISALGGGYQEMASYIVLCFGVSGKHQNRITTHGAKSISKRTGLSYRSSENGIRWLLEKDIVREPNKDDLLFIGKINCRSTKVRYIINDIDLALDVAISNQFIAGPEGIESPLQKLISRINTTEEIGRSRAIMDAIILFAALIREQDFADSAGVPPEIWQQRYESIEGNSDPDLEHSTSIPNTNGVLVAVRAVDQIETSRSFVFDIFDESQTDDMHINEIEQRFWHALMELQRLQLIYKVSVLWSCNPLEAKLRKFFEPIATHYIHDSWARSIDPHMQYEAHKAAWRTGARETVEDFKSDTLGKPAFANSDQYRYIVRKGQETKTCLIRQLRVRWWPANASTVQGREIEARRTTSQIEALRRLG